MAPVSIDHFHPMCAAHMLSLILAIVLKIMNDSVMIETMIIISVDMFTAQEEFCASKM